MARRARWTVCSTHGCGEYTDQGGRCADHRQQAEAARGTARQRGYSGPGWQAARQVVLARDRLCVCAEEGHGHDGPCAAASTVADHYPDERRDLVAAGVPDPDAPHRMRGLCRSCHSRTTAPRTPGGWAA